MGGRGRKGSTYIFQAGENLLFCILILLCIATDPVCPASVEKYAKSKLHRLTTNMSQLSNFRIAYVSVYPFAAFSLKSALIRLTRTTSLRPLLEIKRRSSLTNLPSTWPGNQHCISLISLRKQTMRLFGNYSARSVCSVSRESIWCSRCLILVWQDLRCAMAQ
jgi:hypothetical protein